MLIPAIDLIDGQVVRLRQGDFNRQTTFASSPLALAQDYQQQGAEWLHLVDLDGARNPAQRQLPLITEIAQTVGLRCQAGGGVRSRTDLEQLLQSGIERVVVGSVAVQQPQLVSAWLRQFGGERIVVAIDVNIAGDGVAYAATNGWQAASQQPIEAVLAPLLSSGCQHVLCTDISRDGMLNGSNVALYRRLKQHYPQLQWQASGGVASVDDLRQLKQQGCDSVILGRALLDGRFTLKEALACWQNA